MLIGGMTTISSTSYASIAIVDKNSYKVHCYVGVKNTNGYQYKRLSFH